MSRPLYFILLMGIVSLFGDMTYEGGRSLIGPFLSSLGATGFIVGFVTGLAELVGYGLRYASGFLSDKTKQYWMITGIGYGINLIAVPLLGLANHWEMAAFLIVAERLGKGIRKPPRDAMLSYAAKSVGSGWAFGLHEAMDQMGAVMGPLIVMGIQAWKGSYGWTFGSLAIPALCAMIVFLFARLSFPHPQELEIAIPQPKQTHFPKGYWIYIAAVSLIALGFADFPLIAFHLEQFHDVSTPFIPLLYAIAMAIEGIAALICGKLYDQKGVQVLVWATLLSAFFAPFAFSNGVVFPVIGIVLWAIGMGTQESVMRAVITKWVHSEQRATGYGIFNLFFGIFWFLGSAAMGALYDFSVAYLMLLSVIAQLASVPFFMRLKNECQADRSSAQRLYSGWLLDRRSCGSFVLNGT
jgi:MFS family permease